MRCDLYLNPEYWLGASLFGGILFGGISWGFVYFLIFLFVWEIGYWIYTGYKDIIWDLKTRIGIVLAALLGFLMGRSLHDTCHPSGDYKEFKNDMDGYFKACGWK